MSAAKLTLEDVKDAIAFDQPKLTATRNGSKFVVTGSYLVVGEGGNASPGGPLTAFDVEIFVGERFPFEEPKVFEVGGRIPRCADRHVNPNGDCCVTVWEHWLLRAQDRSFAAFLNGPLREFLLGQHAFEQTGEFPFGERPHGGPGLVEAFADALGMPGRKKKDVVYHLRLLAQPWPKGHWLCPCGSKKRLRHCHKDDLMALHGKVPPKIAKRMLHRLNAYKN